MSELPFNIQKAIEICRDNGITMLGVFGSTARGEATDESDIDLLVRFAEPKSLLAVVRLERKMAEALGRKVDLLTEASISPYLREGILQELRVIYEA